MKKILYILLILLFTKGYGQSLKLVRTDVDSTRSSFVTATYIFGVDIYAEELKRCTAVSFILKWNQTNYITFSEAIFSDFSKNGYVYITDPQVLSTADARIYVGILSGDSVGSIGTENPKLLHLEFAVSQISPNNQKLTFSFENIQAVVSTDSGGKIINIENQNISYNIHGYIDIWPGDANNDNVVNQDDMSTLSLYLKYGSSYKSMRSFKREPTSSIWLAQRALAWDTLDATYADCDGNGDVTITDMLIIGQNFLKTHSVANKSQDSPQGIKFNEMLFDDSQTFKIPVTINLDDKIKAIAGKVVLPEDLSNYRLIGVNRGDIFDKSGSYFYYNQNDNEINYAFIADKSKEVKNKQAICYLLFEKPVKNYNVQSQNMVLNENDNVYQINENYSDIIENETTEKFIINNRILTSNYDLKLDFFDYLGNNVFSCSLSQNQSINLNSLNIGLYIIKTTDFNQSVYNKIILY
jgi:hypothetical protein